VTSDLQTRRVALIHKRLAAVQKNAPLNDREVLATALDVY
jgi:sterol 14-demethylase